MDFEDSSLYLEVKNIIKNAKPVTFVWSAQIHYNKQILDAFKVVSIDVDKNFENNFTDEILVNLLVPQGKFLKRVFPYRNNLEVTLIRKPLSEMADKNNEKDDIKSEKFTAILINKGNPLLESNDSTIPSEEVLDLSNVVVVSFQLINKSVDLLRMKSVGGVYRGGTTSEILQTLLTKESQSIDVEPELSPRGVDMVQASNVTKRDHVVIPHGTKLVNLPQYIQDKCGGIYSSGLGFYFHDRLWYLFPLYNTDRWETSKYKITIINVSGDKLRSIERTYRKDGSNLVILATGDSSFEDKSDQQQLNLGNGVRFTEASKVLDDFVKIKDNKAIAARGANVNEVQTTGRANGNNNIHLSSRPINSNVFREYSDLARREGSIINLLWENANTDYIHPGLVVKILYIEKDEVREVFGTIIKAHIYTSMHGQVMFGVKHHTNIAMSIYVNRKKIQT